MTRQELLTEMQSALARMEARGAGDTKWAASLLRKYKHVRAGGTYAINPCAHNLIAEVGAMIPRTNRRCSNGQVIVPRKRRAK